MAEERKRKAQAKAEANKPKKVTLPRLKSLDQNSFLQTARQSRLVFTRIAAADASGVFLDFGQSCVERTVRATLYPCHRFQSLAVRLNDELGGGGFNNGAHGSPEQIGEVPRLTVVRSCYDHVQSLDLLSPNPPLDAALAWPKAARV